MFRATMGSSSGETTVFMRHLVCLVCRSICSCIPDSHSHRITNTKCRINTVVSPDDGPIVARNMYILININTLKKLCTKLVLFTRQDARSTKHRISLCFTSYGELCLLFINMWNIDVRKMRHYKVHAKWFYCSIIQNISKEWNSCYVWLTDLTYESYCRHFLNKFVKEVK